MKFSRVLVALSAAAFSCAQDNNNYTAGLLAALTQLELTALLEVLPTADPALLSALQEGDHTVFAPSNAALEAAGDTIRNVTSLLQYHITAGPVDEAALNEMDTVYRTLLTDAPQVLLPGNQAQVVSLHKLGNDTIQIDNAVGNATVLRNATYENLHVWVIDSVLMIPRNLSAVVAATDELSALAAAIEGAAPGLIEAATDQRGLTLFAPVNSAITAAAAQLAAANETTIQAVLLNHVLNGTVVYSSQLGDGANYTSAGGQPLTVTSNSTGTWVTSGSASARIVDSNVLTSNGVVHLIDAVLLNTASDPGAASSAYDSATSVAATETTQETEPVTTPNAGVRNLDIATPLKVVAGLVFGALVGTTLL